MFQRLIASIREFIEGVRGELKKVSFPTKTETIGATTVVIVFCILMSLYLSMMDSVLGWHYVGSDDLMEKIKGGWMDFDCAISTPDLMASVGKLGKVLGPRGLMPNPKTGTVTFEVGKAVSEIRKGRVEFKVEKAGIVQVPVGKVSFDVQKLYDNAQAVLESVVKAKPSSCKGRYLKSVTMSSTMGPGVKLDPVALSKLWS